jgi:hypothetical protein
LEEPGEPQRTGARKRRERVVTYRVGRRDQAEARSVVLEWLPPIPVNVRDVDDLAPTVRDVGTGS